MLHELITDQATCRDHHGREARFQAALDAATAKAGFESREAWIAADEDGFERAADALLGR